jgi:hypothetical protein
MADSPLVPSFKPNSNPSFYGDLEIEILKYREFYHDMLDEYGNGPSTIETVKHLIIQLEECSARMCHEYEYGELHTISEYLLNGLSKKAASWFLLGIKAISDTEMQDLPIKKKAAGLKMLREILDVLENYGLHPAINQRDPKQYGRYNVIVEYHVPQAKMSRKESKILLSKADLDRLILTPHKLQIPVQLNGTFIPPKQILRHTITECLLSNEEVPLFRAKHNCKYDIDFCEAFPKVTDDYLENIHLEATSTTSNQTSPFIAQSRIDELKAKTSSSWDMRKLIQLCEELNVNFQVGNFYSVVYLSRALIDHIPPILGCNSFDEVANNYAGDRSFKKATEQLSKTMKHIADLHIHKQIAPSLSIPNMTQVDFSQSMDFLLGELLTKL